jgi:hypothetical protein
MAGLELCIPKWLLRLAINRMRAFRLTQAIGSMKDEESATANVSNK